MIRDIFLIYFSHLISVYTSPLARIFIYYHGCFLIVK